MRSRTPWMLLAAHTLAFLLMLVAQVWISPVANAVSAIGLVIEFPGWRLAWALCHSKGTALLFAWCFNAAMYWTAGLVIDRASSPDRSRGA